MCTNEGTKIIFCTRLPRDEGIKGGEESVAGWCDGKRKGSRVKEQSFVGQQGEEKRREAANFPRFN